MAGGGCLLPFAFLVPRTAGLQVFGSVGTSVVEIQIVLRINIPQKVSFRAQSQSACCMLLYFRVLLLKQKLFFYLIYA